MISTATRYRNYGLPFADLIQEGSVGLLQAAARFEPERGVRFSTYASWWIRSAMQDFIAGHRMLIEGSAGVALAAFLKTRDDYRDKRIAIIICGSNISSEKLEEILA